jgi:hypothetical protein
MLHKNHPWLTLLTGAAATTAAIVLLPSMVDPIRYSALMVFGLYGTTVAGLSLRMIARDGLAPRKPGPPATPHIFITINTPASQLGGLEPPEMLCTDRIVAEADLGDDLADIPWRRLH